MIFNTLRAGRIIVYACLLLASICYSVDTNAGTTNTKNSDKAATISDNNLKKPSNGEPEEDSGSSGLIPMDKLHEIIREERIATLLEIDKERKATLEYLTQERRAVVEELKNEAHRITELIMSERRETMVDLDATGGRIVENTIFKSEQLIDHFFIRLMQFAMIIILAFSILGYISFRIMAKKKTQSS
jgi:hypothetical protein